MADTDTDAAAEVSDVPRSGQDNRDDAKILETARKRLKLAQDATSESRDDELDDLKFKAASPDNPEWHWPSQVLSSRGVGTQNSSTINARPVLVINQLPQHVFQVTNDQRKNRPAGRVVPVNDGADIEVAEIQEGMVRHVEYISDADIVFDTACDNQVTFGEGYFRVLTEYVDEMSFDQEIKYSRIKNSFSVDMDPTIQDPCGADAEWCFISTDMTHEEFERAFPDATPISSLEAGVGNEGLQAWINDKTVRVAEYFYKEYKKVTIILYGDGRSVIKGSQEHQLLELSGVMPMMNTDGQPVERTTQLCSVKWCKTNGYEILQKRDWPGKWIPVIRVVGNEYEIDGRLYVSGLIRNAKDAQRMYNYWVSQEAEMAALAPKAPFIGYAGQFEGYEDKWKTANVQNWPYLEVNPDAADPEGKAYPLPQRVQPPMLSSAILHAKLGASDDIKSTTGQYNPSLGEKSNETSGRAIIARDKKSETGTYHYIDNLARAIRHGTRIIVDLFPKVYDQARVARIVGIDGEVKNVRLDPSQDVPVREIRDQRGIVLEKVYNIALGRYDSAVTTGPSYLTKRQEASEAQSQLLQANPKLWEIAGDLFVKNLDWPGAEQLSKRLAKAVPPNLRDDTDETPEMQQAKQQMQAMQHVIEQQGQMLEHVQKSIEYQNAANEHMKNEIAIYKAESERIKVLAPTMNPEDIHALVIKTLQETLTNPPLESEESGFIEQQEESHQGGQMEMPNQPMGQQMPDRSM